CGGTLDVRQSADADWRRSAVRAWRTSWGRTLLLSVTSGCLSSHGRRPSTENAESSRQQLDLQVAYIVFWQREELAVGVDGECRLSVGGDPMTAAQPDRGMRRQPTCDETGHEGEQVAPPQRARVDVIEESVVEHGVRRDNEVSFSLTQRQAQCK